MLCGLKRTGTVSTFLKSPKRTFVRRSISVPFRGIRYTARTKLILHLINPAHLRVELAEFEFELRNGRIKLCQNIELFEPINKLKHDFGRLAGNEAMRLYKQLQTPIVKKHFGEVVSFIWLERDSLPPLSGRWSSKGMEAALSFFRSAARSNL